MEWSWFIYMGADNDLDQSTAADLEEIRKGNPEKVQVIVQVDHLDRATTRHRLGPKNRFDDFPPIVSKISRTTNMDSRNPAVVSAFLRFAQDNAPSNRRGVVFWSHTAGFQNFTFEGADPDPVEPKPKPLRQRGKKERLEEAENVSKFLRHPNIAKALRMSKNGHRFDIIACDSCLMAMVEVAHEIREHGTYFVASQNNIDRKGWNYDKLLNRFSGRDDKPEDVAKFAVQVGRQEGDSTIAAIRFDRLDDIAGALDELGNALVPLLKSQARAIGQARDEVQLFPRLGYIDLQHFCILLEEKLTNAKAKGAANAVIKAVQDAVISPKAPKSNAHGLTVYVPTLKIDEDLHYDDLSLVKAAPKWADFVRAHSEM